VCREKVDQKVMVAVGPRYCGKRGGVKISIGILTDVHAKEGLPDAVQRIHVDDVSERVHNVRHP
jgi:hypothetical protein